MSDIGLAQSISLANQNIASNLCGDFRPWPTPAYFPSCGCTSAYVGVPYNVTNTTTKTKGDSKMFNNMFGVVRNGQFRLDMNGRIAVQTTNGYKTYNTKKNRLVNCDSFVFDVGDEWFFTVPTMKVKVGDIILINNIPKCVIKTSESTITVLNYESSVVEDILPERHVFMGNAYFYIKVVSMFGNGDSKKKSSKKMMKWMLMSQMFKGDGGFSYSMNPMAMMFMSDMFKDNEDSAEMFDDMFDFGFDEEEEDEE